MGETSRPSVFPLGFGQGLHEMGVFNAKKLHFKTKRPSMTYLGRKWTSKAMKSQFLSIQKHGKFYAICESSELVRNTWLQVSSES